MFKVITKQQNPCKPNLEAHVYSVEWTVILTGQKIVMSGNLHPVMSSELESAPFFFFFFWKQPTISLSSRQAKHMAMSDSCCEVRWLWSLIEELTICKTKLSMIYCDNGGDDGLAKRASHQSCTKHIHA